MWERVEDRLALLEIYVSGTLRRRVSQAAAWDFLAAAQWVRITGRRDEIALRDGGGAKIVALLDRLWPGWQCAAAKLSQRSLPPTPRGWTILSDDGRVDRLPELPPRVNRHTLAALTASHAKVAKAYVKRAGLASEPMRDSILRLRVPGNVVLKTGSRQLELNPIMDALGEVSLPERAIADGLSFNGPLEAVLLIENLGLFCDLPTVAGWMYAFVPGWDTPLAGSFLDCIGTLKVFHSPDLDPNGIRIHEHLRRIVPSVQLFCPSFAGEYIDTRKILNDRKRVWPKKEELHDVPAVVQDLAARGLWIEQEVFAFDQRIPDYMRALLEL